MRHTIASLWLLTASWIVSAAGVALAEDQGLRMGVVPLESSKTMYLQFTPLVEYLQEELGVKVQLVIGKDYQATVDALGKNDVQIAYLTPTTYPKCRKLYADAGIEPLVRFQEEGKGTYRSCIIVGADKQAGTIGDLKGKSFAFGNKDSTASHLMPRSMLVTAGIVVDKDLAKHGFLGTHTNVATAVALGQYDAGGVKDSVAETFEKEGKVKIAARSSDIPEFPICVNKHVSKDLAQKIAAALLKLQVADPKGKAILTAVNKKYTGCEPARDDDYNTIREMIDKLYGPDFYTQK
jgi:phosphonate transport system substrate-binding protein